MHQLTLEIYRCPDSRVCLQQGSDHLDHIHGVHATGQGRAHAAEQRKERESLEETIHSIQLESELTSRALKQTITVSSQQFSELNLACVNVLS